MMLAIGLVGCGRGNPGGPGAQRTTERTTDKNTGEPTSKTTTTTNESDKTFTLKPPLLATKIKQGEKRQVDIGISRGRNFDQGVTLSFEDVPKGVTIEPKQLEVGKTQDDAKISVHVADDAVPETYTLRVKGHPATGVDASNEFKITVEKK